MDRPASFSSQHQHQDGSSFAHAEATSSFRQADYNQDEFWQEDEQPEQQLEDFAVSSVEVLDRIESCTLWFLSELRAGSIPDLQLVSILLPGALAPCLLMERHATVVGHPASMIIAAHTKAV